MRKKIETISLFSLILLSVINIHLLFAQDLPDFSEIKERNVRADLNFLASTELEGREAGLTGGRTAGLFIASQLYQMGLNPMIQPDSTEPFAAYFQTFGIVGVAPEDIKVELTVPVNGKSTSAIQGQDFYYFFNSPAEPEIAGEPVFVGYGIQAPEYDYDDYAGVSCSGKIAIAYYGEPLENDTLTFFNGKHQTQYTLPDWKARRAAEAGAQALVFIPTPENSQKYARILQHKSGRKGRKPFVLAEEKGVPVIYLSAEFTEKVFGNRLNENFEKENARLKKWLAQDGKHQAFHWNESGVQTESWKLAVHYKNEEKRQARNVLAVLPGQDAKLKSEYILIGSHYDHEGLQQGEIFRGADDNASGVAANLNAAFAYSLLPAAQQPRRSVIFAFWDGEEMGMLGSTYFVQHPVIDLKNIKIAFNMDMIGRDASFNFAALRQPMKEEDSQNKVMLFYSAQSPQLQQMAIAANDLSRLHLLFDPNVYFTSGSDHANFQEQHIPVVYYFTGFHTDYTSPQDLPAKIDYKKLTRIAVHIANFAYRLANANELPGFDTKILSAPVGDFKM